MAAVKEVTTSSNNSNSTVNNNQPLFERVILSLENCLLPPERLENAPSFQDGLDKDAELDLRILGCEMIQTAGILLRLPQVVAMGCVCLASKIEEAPRRIRDVINVFNHIKQVRNNRTIQPVILDQNYINLKNQVIKAERRVLKELGFCVHVKHPHKIIVMYLQVLESKNNQQFTQLSWNYMNDSLRTDVFLRYSPETIACACIYLSARQLKIPLPNSPVVWYEIFRVEEDDIREICHILLRLYTRPKPNVDKLEKAVDELKKAQEEAKLRAKGLSASNTPQTGSFSPNSRSNSPNKNERSPTTDLKKDKNQENSKGKNNHVDSPNKRSKDKDANHVKNHTPTSNASRKSASHSSRSHSRSPSPKRNRRSSPPRGYKNSRKAVSAPSPHSKSRSRSKSIERKKHRTTKHRRSRSRSHSYAHSPHRNHKKSHKEKPRYRSRSRERAYRSRSRSYDKYGSAKSRKVERPSRDNGHHRSRSRERNRR